MQNLSGGLPAGLERPAGYAAAFRDRRLATKLILAILAVALAGASAAVWTAEPVAEFGRVSAALPAIVRRDAADGTARSAGLAEELRAIARSARIRPDQEAAWTRFAGVVSTLDGLTRAHDRRRAAGEAIDDEAERASHALLLGGALADLYEVLSPGQAATVRRLTGDLTRTVVCRGILDS